MVLYVQGVQAWVQEGEGEALDTMVLAMHRRLAWVQVGVAHGDHLTMPSCTSGGGERGQVRCIEVQGGARVQRWGEGGQGWTKSIFLASMGTCSSSACKVFYTMAARKEFLNFDKINFG